MDGDTLLSCHRVTHVYSEHLKQQKQNMPTTRLFVGLVVLVGAAGIIWLVRAKQQKHNNNTRKNNGMQNASVMNTSLKLWLEHVFYTREVLLAYFAAKPDLPVALNRLMQNQADLGAYFGQFLGRQTGDAIHQLLVEHIQGAVALVQHLSDSPSVVNEYRQKWYANGQQIGESLNKVLGITGGPDMMHAHLQATEEEAGAMAHGQWAQAMTAFQNVVTLAQQMAVHLSMN